MWLFYIINAWWLWDINYSIKFEKLLNLIRTNKFINLNQYFINDQ